MKYLLIYYNKFLIQYETFKILWLQSPLNFIFYIEVEKTYLFIFVKKKKYTF